MERAVVGNHVAATVLIFYSKKKKRKTTLRYNKSKNVENKNWLFRISLTGKTKLHIDERCIFFSAFDKKKKTVKTYMYV